MFLLNNNCCAHPSSGPLYSFITASTVLSWQCTGHCQCIHAHALRTLCWHKPLCIVAKHACNRVFYFQYGSIILPRLWASIGVTRSYSSRPFLCALAIVCWGYTFSSLSVNPGGWTRGGVPLFPGTFPPSSFWLLAVYPKKNLIHLYILQAIKIYTGIL